MEEHFSLNKTTWAILFVKQHNLFNLSGIRIQRCPFGEGGERMSFKLVARSYSDLRLRQKFGKQSPCFSNSWKGEMNYLKDANWWANL